MIKKIKKLTAPFRKDESGSTSIEFVLYFTVFFVILTAAVEMAYINLRHAMLERAVDLVTRDIRLNTGAIPTYTEVKTKICNEAQILYDCEANLRLEMVQIDPRNATSVPSGVDCQNAVSEPHPVRNFVAGQDNDLMLLRACLKYEPLSPGADFATQLSFDVDGYTHMVVTAAFVQEPR